MCLYTRLMSTAMRLQSFGLALVIDVPSMVLGLHKFHSGMQEGSQHSAWCLGFVVPSMVLGLHNFHSGIAPMSAVMIGPHAILNYH